MKKIFFFAFLFFGLLVVIFVIKNNRKTPNKRHQSITVSKNQTINIPGTDLKLKVQSIEIPGINCRDCMTLVNLKLEKNGQIKDLNFYSGGIAGVIVDQINAFGYSFKLESFEENKINLTYYKI